MKNYGILSIIFLLLSLAGGIYLVKNNQNLQNKAEDGCWATCRCSCGLTFCANPSGRGCQYECLDRCGELSHYGSLTGTPGAPCTIANVNDKCISAKSGTLDVVNHYKCPGFTSMPPAGCQDNVETLRNVSQVCVDESFCGVQQIDYRGCFVSYLKLCQTPTDAPKDTPTPTPTQKPSSTPTLTPIPTKKPSSTPTPTPTKKPSSTPTSTPTPLPTNTPIPTSTTTPQPTSTSTPQPTSTPNPTPTPNPTSTPTPLPTNTPIPTSTPEYIAEGPTPTRIILPQSGVEFPAQMLTIFGGIVTLLGFLILL